MTRSSLSLFGIAVIIVKATSVAGADLPTFDDGIGLYVVSDGVPNKLYWPQTISGTGDDHCPPGFIDDALAKSEQIKVMTISKDSRFYTYGLDFGSMLPHNKVAACIYRGDLGSRQCSKLDGIYALKFLPIVKEPERVYEIKMPKPIADLKDDLDAYEFFIINPEQNNCAEGFLFRYEGSRKTRENYELKLFNVDDYAVAYVNGSRVDRCIYGQNCDISLDRYLNKGSNTIKIEYINDRGGMTWGYALFKGDKEVSRESCGIMGVQGCNGMNNVPQGIHKIVEITIDY
jgi:hypothetical protein